MDSTSLQFSLVLSFNATCLDERCHFHRISSPAAGRGRKLCSKRFPCQLHNWLNAACCTYAPQLHQAAMQRAGAYAARLAAEPARCRDANLLLS